MLLAIDVGNTNMVFALMDGEAVRRQWRISTSARRTADEYMVWLSRLFELAQLPLSVVDGAIIATVVPSALFDLTRLCRTYFDVAPMVVGTPGVDFGIAINIDRPAEVGADRAVNAVAASALRPGEDLIVVDFGTATTFDVVGRAGSYEGGVIAPGINVSMDALFQAAARLPRIAVEPPSGNGRTIGKNTVDAMQSGVFWGYIGLIEGLVGRIKAEIGSPMTVIATGGLAGTFERHTAAIDLVDTDLTLRGLALVYQSNMSKRNK